MATNDPNEAYAIIPKPIGPGQSDFLSDWLTVTRYGVPVRHYSPEHRAAAEKYCTDPDYRAQIAADETPLHLRKKV
jgi:hypothetical protein